MLDKSMGLTVDCAAYDVEDSVTPDLKQSARHGLRDFLNTTRPKGISEVAVRINSVHSKYVLDDLVEVVSRL